MPKPGKDRGDSLVPGLGRFALSLSSGTNPSLSHGLEGSGVRQPCQPSSRRPPGAWGFGLKRTAAERVFGQLFRQGRVVAQSGTLGQDTLSETSPVESSPVESESRRRVESSRMNRQEFFVVKTGKFHAIV